MEICYILWVRFYARNMIINGNAQTSLSDVAWGEQQKQKQRNKKQNKTKPSHQNWSFPYFINQLFLYMRLGKIMLYSATNFSQKISKCKQLS